MRLSSSSPPSIAHLRRLVIHVTTRQYRTATPWTYQGRQCVVQHGYRHGRGIAKRHLHVGNVLMPPAIFTGLFLALWCYKCIMLVLFQNAIIYNPFLPPNARSMQISEFARQCGGVEWREDRIRSLDGTEIALCISEMSCGKESAGAGSSKPPKTPVYILYFQGNASSLPPRLPDLSGVLRQLKAATEGQVHYTMVCLSYRGYWTSHDRPSEKGIDLDAEAALRWITRLHRERYKDAQAAPITILWGQSIGCGFATNLAAKTQDGDNLPINALVLETPFTNTRAMLEALYPQKWLPYRHLWPFLRNHLDSWANLGLIAAKAHRPEVYIVEAGKDELVPSDHGRLLYQRCQELQLFAELHTVSGALHNDVMVKRQGKQAIAQSIASAVSRARESSDDQVQRLSGLAKGKT
ncbi:Protein ABHD13 [Trichoderma ghanense]|uniref:Protein ABHD13 n=1 Tax=Trichoderma ghanense TaxID=65468 RepID=A0ABY2H416_9HYPO